jgi:cell division protease FtsH
MSAGPEPTPSEPGGHRPTGPNAASLLSTLLIATLAIGVLTIVAGRGTGRDVSYTEFRQRVQAGEVTDAVVGSSRIRWTHRSGDRYTTIRVDDPSLVGDLEAHGVTVTGEVSSDAWTGLIWFLPILLLMVVGFRLMREGGVGGQGALAFGRSRARIYAESDVKVTFADVAGIDEATEELREIVDFLQHPGKYTELGGRIPKGVLLVGPPGTGKTLLARAVAGEARVPFFSLSGSEFVEMFVGVGAARVRDLFTQAEGRAPCIIFIDELDAIGRMRTVSPLGTHEEREQTLNQLLAEMDGFDPRKGIIVMSATNRPEVLDPALLRAGRFDRRVVVDRPDVNGREAILRLHAGGVRLAPEVDLRVVATRTTGFAGADLANLVNEATLLAARRGHRAVGMSDFEEALDRLVAGLKRKRLMSAREREIVAVHEAGHAIVASRLPGVDSVHRVSIVQRGYDALGHTLQMPAEERYLKTRQELSNQLAVWLGGRAAEALVFHEISTGGHNDLQQATEVARAMVAQFGMSEAVGPVAFDVRRRQAFLGGGAEPAEPVAQETAREIDLEVKRLMIDADGRARQILGEDREALDTIVRRLLEQEVVEGDEIRHLLSQQPATDAVPT